MTAFDKPYPPTVARVGVGYLRALAPSIADSIATSLPAVDRWPAGLFVTVNDLPGGAPEIDLPQLRHAYVTLDVYAAFPDNDNPQWGRAAIGAELLRGALDSAQPYGRPLDLGPDYRAARVQAAYAISEPRKVEDDPSAFARYTFDAQIDWAALPAPFAEL